MKEVDENVRLSRLRILLKDCGSKNIMLYGAGHRGEVALDNLRSIQMDHLVKGFVDDNKRKEKVSDKPVFSFDEICEDDLHSCIFAPTTNNVKAMVSRLGKLGVPVDNILYAPELLITDYKASDIPFDKVEEVGSMLDDALSGYIYKTIIDIYMTGNIGVLSQTMGECQYFPTNEMSDHVNGFELDENECFIDCGAYDGDTIRVFETLTKNEYSKIYAFEADEINYKRLYDNYGRDKRVVLRDKAVWSSVTKLQFRSDNGWSSAIDDEGTTDVFTTTLDEELADEEHVSLIKMDIEGSELEALKGGAEVIKRCHPKLAICIYHKLEDLWEIPFFIKSLYDGYHLYIRNYQDRLDEIVLYAIP